MPTGQFGASVAAFDIDGKPGDEMFIGNPDGYGRRHDHRRARVRLHGLDRRRWCRRRSFPIRWPSTIPGAGHGYGSGIAGMTFCPGNVGGADAGTGTGDGGVAACKRLPIIGSLSKVFAYFTLNKPDPRVK